MHPTGVIAQSRTRWLTKVAALLIGLLGTAGFGLAETLPEPTGDIVLVVTGDIATTNRGDEAVFDLDMLMSMPREDIQTATPWTEGRPVFSGVPLSALLDRLGVSEGALQAFALNDYSVTIPVIDAADIGPIIAFLRNGKPMTVRQKGPLWVMYPFDSSDGIDNEVYRSRAIWQLSKIDVAGP